MNTHLRTFYVGTVPEINLFLLAEGGDVNLKIKEIPKKSKIITEYLPKSLVKQSIKLPKILDKIFNTKWRNSVKLDKTRKV